MNTLTRKAQILKLRLHCWLCWLAVELEPAGSTEFRTIAAHYARAKGRLNQALLDQRAERKYRREF